MFFRTILIVNKNITERMIMSITEDLLKTLPHGEVIEVRIGTHWTAVVVDVSGDVRCGLASTLLMSHDHHAEPDLPEAGQLETVPALELAHKINSGRYPLASVAAATINALLPKGSWDWAEKNAEEVIRSEGAGKKVVIVGRFPFNQSLKSHVGKLTILEQEPEGAELPQEAASEVIPEADIVAITGMTFINRTMEPLIDLCSKDALVLILGPSTPLSPVLFNQGVSLLSGSVVTDIDRVLQVIGQGANFRQVHRAGVLLVTLDRAAF
jgi:uncharacterized protein (DUF4213/DUF364 family)